MLNKRKILYFCSRTTVLLSTYQSSTSSKFSVKKLNKIHHLYFQTDQHTPKAKSSLFYWDSTKHASFQGNLCSQATPESIIFILFFYNHMVFLNSYYTHPHKTNTKPSYTDYLTSKQFFLFINSLIQQMDPFFIDKTIPLHF